MFRLYLLWALTFTVFSCSSDDDDCPDSMIVDINDPDSIEQAEDCGLSPAEPLGTLWISDNYVAE